MRTFKATLKILLAQRLMILIYVVWLCLMMFGLSWSLISDLSKMDNSTTFDSARPEVAVVNRDAHGAGLDEPMRAFLERTATSSTSARPTSSCRRPPPRTTPT